MGCGGGWDKLVGEVWVGDWIFGGPEASVGGGWAELVGEVRVGDGIFEDPQTSFLAVLSDFKHVVPEA